MRRRYILSIVSFQVWPRSICVVAVMHAVSCCVGPRCIETLWQLFGSSCQTSETTLCVTILGIQWWTSIPWLKAWYNWNPCISLEWRACYVTYVKNWLKNMQTLEWFNMSVMVSQITSNHSSDCSTACSGWNNTNFNGPHSWLLVCGIHRQPMNSAYTEPVM